MDVNDFLLTGDFRNATLRVSGAEVRPVRVEEIAQRLRCSPRWVRKRYVPQWLARGFPRVTVAPLVTSTGRTRPGRPYYTVDRSEFERWMRPYAVPVSSP